MPITTRDEKGKFLTTILSSEEAAEMGHLGGIKAKQKAATVEELLDLAGYSTDNPAPVHVRLIAEDAVKSGRSPVVALREFMRLANLDGSGAKPAAPEPGSICPTCSRYVGDLPGDVLVKLLAALEWYEDGLELRRKMGRAEVASLARAERAASGAEKHGRQAGQVKP